jgi:hypothetical protein
MTGNGLKLLPETFRCLHGKRYSQHHLTGGYETAAIVLSRTSIPADDTPRNPSRTWMLFPDGLPEAHCRLCDILGNPMD